MAAERIDIERFMELAGRHPVLDVRSPGEYGHAHLPGAVSFPLFDDEERKQVGTAYKQKSREEAIRLGLDFFGPRMKPMVDNAESILGTFSNNGVQGKGSSRTLLVYCWRGGMRSGAVSWLLDMYGIKVYTLVGGYKKFRHFVLDTFSLPFNFMILGGYTGSGKTELLKELEKRGKATVDLEAIASHKGSAFGNIGMPKQPAQEMFENQLALALRSRIRDHDYKPGDTGISHSPYALQQCPIWLEDESQRIGQVNIPGALWDTMRRSRLHFLDIPFEERLAHLVDEYGGLDRQRMLDAIGRITAKLGGLNAKMASQYLDEGNTIESFRILLNYYDKVYLKGMHNREGLETLLHTIECNSVTIENAQRLVAEPRFQHEKP